jgi:GNAT superfamily N-acetyltransferase
MTASSMLAQDLHLRDGLTVSARPVTLEDEMAIWEFLTKLSIDSRRLRFFGIATNLRAQAHRGAAGDDVDHHGVLAIVPGGHVVGHAVYVRVPHSDRAEVAVVVADDLHHLGLATLLMIRLGQFAEQREITRFFAEVLPENDDMLAVFRDGFGAVTIKRQDVIEVEFPTSSWRGAHARFER